MREAPLAAIRCLFTHLTLINVAPEQVRIFRLTLLVISVLDYSKGFGHTDLVTCS